MGLAGGSTGRRLDCPSSRKHRLRDCSRSSIAKHTIEMYLFRIGSSAAWYRSMDNMQTARIEQSAAPLGPGGPGRDDRCCDELLEMICAISGSGCCECPNWLIAAVEVREPEGARRWRPW